MAKLRNQARATFDRLFPERQIYHRSGGTVRYISISPWQQVIIAGGLSLIAAWSLYATGKVLLGSPGSGLGMEDSREIAKYERWVSELRAKDALSRSLLEERTDEFQQATLEFEERHETLKILLNALQGGEDLEVTSLRGDGAGLLVEASIDEADVRQSREAPKVTASMEVVGLRAKINKVEVEQEEFLEIAEDIAVQRAEAARGVLNLTAVGSGRIQTNMEMGGPLVQLASLAASDADDPVELAFNKRVLRVAARLEEARYYEALVEQLPLAMPSEIPLRKTSNYGVRTDPFTKNATWHSGMDMAAYWKAPINASGPGKVVFAGYKSGYGRTVDIEHGYGFKSRYAHMHSILVKKGDTVAMGDKVGLMGSSGRSTGPHLHYEIWFNGKQYDPAQFLKAGKHVHEKQ